MAVTGPTASLALGSLVIAPAGAGSIDVTGGGHLAATNATLPDEGGSAILAVSDPGSSLDVTTLDLASGGDATLDLTTGAAMTSLAATIATRGDATILLDGGGSSWTIDDPGRFGTASFVLGRGTLGALTVSPPPPTRTGTLTVSGGAQLTTDEAYL